MAPKRSLQNGKGRKQSIGATPWLPRLPGQTTCPCPASRKPSTPVATWSSHSGVQRMCSQAFGPRRPAQPYLQSQAAESYLWLRCHLFRRGQRDRGLHLSSLAMVGRPPPPAGFLPLGPAKSRLVRSPFVTPGASNHSVSISLTLFIPLKTHLKTLQPGVCSGLYPH